MGLGICQVLALAGAETRLASSSPARTVSALESLVRRTEIQADAGLRSPQAMEMIGGVRAAGSVEEAVEGADIVFEAVPERLDLKLAVLDEASRAMPTRAVLGTNTSSLPIRTLAGSVTGGERFMGIHWFNPAEWIPGVEVVPSAETDPETLQRLVHLLRELGKRPVIVSDTPGFVANRLQYALFTEALRCLEEGVATPEQIDDAVRGSFGFRLPFFGPFRIADMAGLDVYAAVYEVLERELGPRFAPPALFGELVEVGRLGTKTGEGFHDYDPEKASALLAARDRFYAALAELLREQGSP